MFFERFTDEDRRVLYQVRDLLLGNRKGAHLIERTLMADAALLAKLAASAQNQTTVNASTEALLTTISQELKDALNNDDSAAIQAVIDTLDANNTELGAAVTANTPAASTAPAPVVDAPPVDNPPVDETPAQ
jgi:hypothetical protein